jgi:hypothetical protein
MMIRRRPTWSALWLLITAFGVVMVVFLLFRMELQRINFLLFIHILYEWQDSKNASKILTMPTNRVIRSNTVLISRFSIFLLPTNNLISIMDDKLPTVGGEF